LKKTRFNKGKQVKDRDPTTLAVLDREKCVMKGRGRGRDQGQGTDTKIHPALPAASKIVVAVIVYPDN
jgi:hypothetical protein